MLMPRECADVGIVNVDFDLSEQNICRYSIGKKVYVRTRYLVFRHGLQMALARIHKTRPRWNPNTGEKYLFSSITSVEVLAHPEETMFIRSNIAVLCPTEICSLALSLGARCLIVQGESEHVGFVLDPEMMEVYIYDYVPPYPPRLSVLLAQAERLLKIPVKIRKRIIDLEDMVRRAPTTTVVLPCDAGAVSVPGKIVRYLRESPDLHGKVTLIGCRVSKRIFEELYPDMPFIFQSICPKDASDDSEGLKLMRCCSVRRGCEVCGDTVTIPNGARVEEVARAITVLSKNKRTLK